MLIIIRGTMGSGKSHIVKQVIEDLGRNDLVLEDLQGKRWTIGHHFPKQDLFVVGHYNHSTWSGADKFWGIGENLRNPKAEVFALLKRSIQKYGVVLFESAHANAWVDEIADLNKLTDVLAIQLTTPVEMCLDSLAKRRAGIKSSKPISAKTEEYVSARYRSYMKNSGKLVSKGVKVLYLNRNQALDRTREAISSTSSSAGSSTPPTLSSSNLGG